MIKTPQQYPLTQPNDNIFLSTIHIDFLLKLNDNGYLLLIKQLQYKGKALIGCFFCISKQNFNDFCRWIKVNEIRKMV